MSKREAPRILVVEDDTLLRNGIADVLKLAGYEVMAAKNGLQGMEVLRQVEAMPNLIVSDVRMEPGNGLQFFKSVRTEPQWRQIPFIFLTGIANFSEMFKSLPTHRDQYMKKPFGIDELLAAVKQLLSPTATS